MSTAKRDKALVRAAKMVDDIVMEIFGSLREGADDALALWSRSADAAGTLATADLAGLRPSIETRLNTHPYFDGTGLVVDPSALRDAAGYQEWWRPAGDGEFEFLDVKTGFGEEPYEYTTMSWFQGAAHGLDSVRGPYVDLTGSDLYVLTFAVPVCHQNRFIGASAADVTVADFESLAIPELTTLDIEVVVVNSADRVVVSSSPDHSAGERMRAADTADTRVGGPGVDWRVHLV